MKKIFIVFLTCVFFGSVVYAIEGGGIGGRPANPDPSIPNSREWFIYTLNPGESKKDAIVVQNSRDEAVDLRLYPADSTPSTDGGFALEQRVEPRDFVGAWITLSQTEVHLDPNESKTIPFAISVPNDPTLDVGEHTGGILIEKVQQESTAGGLQLSTRVGVRVYVTIPGEIIKKLDIEKFTVELDEARNMYIATIVVKNSGNVSQDVVISKRITGISSWFDRFLKKQFPLENEKNLQVLRDSSLTSHFEFPKPVWGTLFAEASVAYENKNKTLSIAPVIVKVPLDRNIVILIVVALAFAASLIALVTLKKYGSKKSKSKH